MKYCSASGSALRDVFFQSDLKFGPVFYVPQCIELLRPNGHDIGVGEEFHFAAFAIMPEHDGVSRYRRKFSVTRPEDQISAVELELAFLLGGFVRSSGFRSLFPFDRSVFRHEQDERELFRIAHEPLQHRTVPSTFPTDSFARI